MASAQSAKLAVLVNDLGEVNIDARLIKRSLRTMKEPIGDVVELTSGCICCSIQTDDGFVLPLPQPSRSLLIEQAGSPNRSQFWKASTQPTSKVRSTFEWRIWLPWWMRPISTTIWRTRAAARRAHPHLQSAAALQNADGRSNADLLLLNKTDQIQAADAGASGIPAQPEHRAGQRCAFGRIVRHHPRRAIR